MNRRNILAILAASAASMVAIQPPKVEAEPNIVKTEWYEWVGPSGKKEGFVPRNVWSSKEP